MTAGQTYKFQPQASDPDRDRITFTISNKPQWATFDPETGLLTGTPSDKDVGDYKAIEIAATDGKTVVALPEFSITVLQPGAVTRSVALAWDPPTGNSDGTPLTDLAGYRIHYGKASKSYEGTISVDNPSVTRYVVENLGAGTYFFAVTALNAAGAESDFSEEVSTTVN